MVVIVGIRNRAGRIAQLHLECRVNEGMCWEDAGKQRNRQPPMENFGHQRRTRRWVFSHRSATK